MIPSFSGERSIGPEITVIDRNPFDDENVEGLSIERMNQQLEQTLTADSIQFQPSVSENDAMLDAYLAEKATEV